MRSRFALTALVAATLSSGLAAQEQEITSDTVVARVGDVEITMGQVVIVRQGLPPQYAQLPDAMLFGGIVDQLVDQYLLSESMQGSELPTSLKLRLENERRGLLANHRIQNIIAEGVSDEDLQAAYDETYGSQPPKTEFNASHILLETEDEAKAVVEELEGGADFAELAAEKSTGPSGPNGGQLGWFGAGTMVPEFEAAVTELEAETISAPVQTQFGWHVIRLNETREVPPPSLEDTRDELTNTLNQQAVQELIASLRDENDVEVLTGDIPESAFRDDALLPE